MDSLPADALYTPSARDRVRELQNGRGAPKPAAPAMAPAATAAVAPAAPSESALAKKQSKRTPEGLPLRHFNGLLSTLATLCSNTCRVGEGKHATRFQRPTVASVYQHEAFRLLNVKMP